MSRDSIDATASRGRASAMTNDTSPSGGSRANGTPPRAILPKAPEGLGDDVLTVLYRTTSKNKDSEVAARMKNVSANGVERAEAQKAHDEELRKAKEEREGGFLGAVMSVVDTATDMVVGGNPLQDLASKLTEATGCEVFTVAYDVVRPDAMLNAAATLASEASGKKEIAGTYDVVAGSSSLKARFQGAADATGKDEVMQAYDVTKQSIVIAGATGLSIASAGSCTALLVLAIVAASVSAASMVDGKLHLLEKVGVSEEAAGWIRIGVSGATIAMSVGGSIGGAVAGAGGAASGAAKAAAAARRAAAAAQVVRGASQLAVGAGQVDQAVREKSAAGHMIAADEQKNAMKKIDRQTERVVSGIREVAASYQRALESLAGAIFERQQLQSELAQIRFA